MRTPTDSTTAGWLRRGVSRSGHGTAVVDSDDALTYDELGQRCARLAAALRRWLTTGDRVAVLAANSFRYLELYLAVTGAGMVFVPLDPSRPENELRTILGDAGVAVVFTDRDVSALGVDRVVSLGTDYERLLAHGVGGDVVGEDPDTHADSLAALFYTGGTTGTPKGVMLTHGNLTANARNLVRALDIGADTRWLIAAPMFHISGTIGTLAILGRGGQQIVPAVNEPDALLDVAARLDATTTLVLPPMLAALAAAQRLRPRPLPSLRMITHGGGPITDAEVSRAHAAFPQSELVHLYGATELSPIATVLRGEEFLVGDDRGRSCGRAIGNVAIEIRDSSGTEVAVGQFGEVVVRGATVMTGYWNRPDISEEVIDDGWYRTGDIGRVDEDGYLYVVDRTADVIRRGDRMVFSTTVERALCAIEGVWEAAVLPDDNNGFYAVVVVNDANAIADCRRALAGFGVPWKIATRSEPLPRSGAGKVLKRLLRDPDR